MLNMLNQLDQSYADGGPENPAFSFGANNFAESVNAQQETQIQSGATLSWPSKDPFDEVASKSISVPYNEKQVSLIYVSITVHLGSDQHRLCQITFQLSKCSRWEKTRRKQLR
jgi:hypothetical protein